MKVLPVISALAIALLAASPVMAQTSPPASQSQPKTTGNPSTLKNAPALQSGNKNAGKQTAAIPGAVNLNTASASELDSLPGIGSARADAIIKNRPYKSPDELVSKHIIPSKVYDGLKDKVSVR